MASQVAKELGRHSKRALSTLSGSTSVVPAVPASKRPRKTVKVEQKSDQIVNHEASSSSGRSKRGRSSDVSNKQEPAAAPSKTDSSTAPATKRAKSKRSASKDDANAKAEVKVPADKTEKQHGNVDDAAVYPDGKVRCWTGIDGPMMHYHDSVWGRPSTDSRALFEQLCLQGMQSGISWRIVMNKLENFRKAFDQFDFYKIAKYTDKDFARLMADAGIIRNGAKIRAIINNAKLAVKIENERPGGLVKYLWSFAPTNDSERFISAPLPKTHMRTDFTTKPEDRTHSDCVHPTVSQGVMSKVHAGLAQRHRCICGHC